MKWPRYSDRTPIGLPAIGAASAVILGLSVRDCFYPTPDTKYWTESTQQTYRNLNTEQGKRSYRHADLDGDGQLEIIVSDGPGAERVVGHIDRGQENIKVDN